MKFYILSTTKAVIPVSSERYVKWITEFGYSNQLFSSKISGFSISTVFLGIDHDLSEPDMSDSVGYQPLVFETMIFQSQVSGYEFQRRYRTHEEAEATHIKIVDYVERYGKIPCNEEDFEDDEVINCVI